MTPAVIAAIGLNRRPLDTRQLPSDRLLAPDRALAGSRKHRAAHPKSRTQVASSGLRSMPKCDTVSGAWKESTGKSQLKRRQLIMNAKQVVRRFLRRMGYDIVRYAPTSHPLARRKRLLEISGINIVLDVGANVGQYAKQLRDIGYKGEIISFEPLSSAYKELLANANADGHWKAMNYALGITNGKTEINISALSCSSSILEMLPSHMKSAPESKYVGKEQIEVRTLDSVFENICSREQNILLKIDTQGFERHVIEGAENSLRFIDAIQLEMSLIPLYKGGPLFDEMYKLLCREGYCIVSIEPGFSDKESGQLLQVDGIFHRL